MVRLSKQECLDEAQKIRAHLADLKDIQNAWVRYMCWRMERAARQLEERSRP